MTLAKDAWPRLQLDEIAEVMSGNSIPAKDRNGKFSSSKVTGRPFVSTKDVGFNGVVSLDTEVAIPDSSSSDFKLAPAQSTLVCSEGGSAGRKVGWLEANAHFGNKLFCVTASRGVDPKFLHYFHLTDDFSSQFKERMAGLIGGVSLNKFKSITLPLPPLEEQKRIVAVLDQALTALDRARALAEANLADADGLARESTRQALLPSANSESWQRVSLGDCIDVLSGFAFKSANYVDDGHFLVRIANVQDGELSLQRPQFVALDEKTIRFELSAGDILTSLTGNIGRVAEVAERHLPAALNQRVAKLSPKANSPITRNFLLLFLKSELFGEPLREKGHGAAQLNVSPKEIKKLDLWHPPREDQEAITNRIDRIEDGHRFLRESYLAAVQDLEELRQSLLQKAFAGELT